MSMTPCPCFIVFARQGKAYLTYTTDTNISAAVQMCALNDSLEERVGGDADLYPVREMSAQRAHHHATAR